MSAVEAVEKELEGEKLGTRNVSKLSTYALRQELVRREKLDIPEEEINHNNMLKRLIEELVKDEAKVTEERTEGAVDAAQQERDAAKALREKKKQEAIDRSKARQAQKGYFSEKSGANESGQKELDEKSKAAAVSDGAEEGEGEKDLEEPENDPFRSYKPSGRSKIHIS